MRYKIATCLVALMLTIIVMMIAMPARTEGVRYSVQPVYPNNQRPGSDGYFNLMMTPGRFQEIEVQIKNAGASTLYVEVTANPARTNINGIVDYAPPRDGERFVEQGPAFTDIVAVREAVIAIPAGTSHFAAFDIAMPSEDFEGVIVGGLHFVEVIEPMGVAAPQARTGIVNRIAYAVPLVLRVGEDVPIASFAIDGVALDANEPEVMMITLRNGAPRISHMNDFTALIFMPRRDDEPVEVVKKSRIQLTPHAVPEVRFWRTSGTMLPPGTYRIVATFYCDDELHQIEGTFDV